ncbi:MAG: elongation factor Ts [Myxococcales bacterium]|nr:elongation factor Ts [Myxococcales bacterium]USN51352.1 MAG: elongation factor Ts [Myxococcales bacterium]
MTQISASMVKELREKTGAGMMDCKNALSDAGDMEGAIKILREKGLARAAKKTSRIAAEGLIGILVSGHKASIAELNCETDFVARNDDFKNVLDTISKTAQDFDIQSCADCTEIDGSLLASYKTANGATVEELITDKVATIGEKIALRRFAVLSGGDLYGSYIHGAGSIGVLVECKLDDPQGAQKEEVQTAARDIAMHIAASNPAFISEKDIPDSWIASEKEIFKAQVLASGKPENMVDKIVDGKMAKHKKDFCLLDQAFVKNPDLSIQGMLDALAKSSGTRLSVSCMVRFKVGEGIEKKEDNLAEEVKKMTA